MAFAFDSCLSHFRRAAGHAYHKGAVLSGDTLQQAPTEADRVSANHLNLPQHFQQPQQHVCQSCC